MRLLTGTSFRRTIETAIDLKKAINQLIYECHVISRKRFLQSDNLLLLLYKVIIFSSNDAAPEDTDNGSGEPCEIPHDQKQNFGMVQPECSLVTE